jgi:hypothetical protein
MALDWENDEVQRISFTCYLGNHGLRDQSLQLLYPDNIFKNTAFH